MSTKKILVVLTSHSDLGDTGHKTGFWVEEFAAPYYAFIDAGAEVTVATPKGGQAPIDPNSEAPDAQTGATTRFYEDQTAQDIIANTHLLSDMKQDDFDAIFYPGGHGPLWDLTDNTDSIALIESFLQANKPISSVCHAPSAFLNIKDASGEYFIKGKTVTGFTNSEEAAVQLTDIVPFLLEDEMKKRGADYKNTADWTAFAVQDGLMITGQNPASSELVAEKLLAQLNK
ncbi:type 1 glutamine amidotransferase domain-containing protein [Marinomonas primoryensis]|jgi:putative intracellular protease/amidase|uniref:Type 1 glutamine amidotransferase domain-containing protein n=1 Tax=Marinomonas primoryensis TaxID=178399 RepID=A0ABV0L4N2_9GAMM|tara:strand:+ start:285 stop:974 length:690 start_codon:yes stop_codon:yes gene_type:complete